MMRRGILTILLFTILFTAAAGYALLEEWQWDHTLEMTVEVTADGKTEEITCWENESGEYYVFLPGYAELSQVRLRTHTFRTVRLDKLSIADGMTCENIELGKEYGLVYNGEDYYPITFLRSGNVPTMYIDTASGNMDYIHENKDNKEAGTLRLYAKDGTLTHTEILDTIKGRGNGTWVRSKKPYSLTLSSQADFLGMGAARRWILLANACDDSNIRNKLIYDASKNIQLPFSPESDWVDLYLNGEYAGLYLLSERNEVHPNRVDIPQSNSFLVSMEPPGRLTSQNYPFVQTTRDSYFRLHHAGMETDRIQQILQSVENAIFSEDGTDPITQKRLDQLIDLDSWARKYLVEEVFANFDSNISQFYYYTGDGKLYAGPVWDYDFSLGNPLVWQIRSPQAILAGRQYIHNLTTPLWAGTLYRNSSFFQYLRTIYQKEFRPLINQILEESLETYFQHIRQAAAVNSVRRYGDLLTEYEVLRNYLTERMAFLDSLLLQEEPYHYVHIHNEEGTWGCFAVRPGELLTHLPPAEDKDGRKCLGWFDAFTGEPFDITQPIYEDAVIQMKWEQ